jgi:hypothetical protein
MPQNMPISFTRIIVNPYWRSQEQRQIAQTNAQAVAETTIKMGIQSQQREGDVKKCNKWGHMHQDEAYRCFFSTTSH